MLKESVGGRGGGRIATENEEKRKRRRRRARSRSIATEAEGEDSFKIEGLVNKAEFWELDPYWEDLKNE